MGVAWEGCEGVWGVWEVNWNKVSKCQHAPQLPPLLSSCPPGTLLTYPVLGTKPVPSTTNQSPAPRMSSLSEQGCISLQLYPQYDPF